MSEKVVKFRPKIHKKGELPDKIVPDGSEPSGGDPFHLPISDTEYLYGYSQVIDAQLHIYVETFHGYEPIITVGVIDNSLCTTTHVLVQGMPEPQTITRHLFTNYKESKK